MITKTKNRIEIYASQMRWQFMLFIFMFAINYACDGQTPSLGDPNWSLIWSDNFLIMVLMTQ